MIVFFHGPAGLSVGFVGGSKRWCRFADWECHSVIYINCFKWFVPEKNWSSMQNVQHNSLWWILVQLFYGVTTLAGCIAKSGLMNLGSKGMVSASKPTITLIEVTVNLPWKIWNELLMQPFEFISSCTCAYPVGKSIHVKATMARSA